MGETEALFMSLHLLKVFGGHMLVVSMRKNSLEKSIMCFMGR